MATLERSLGLWEVTLMGVGLILGAGIYVVIGEAAGLAGNALWASFILAALVATCTGLSYAELSSRFPFAGAEYEYVKHSFGSMASWITSYLIIVGSCIGGATVALGFSNYFSALFQTPVLPVAIGMLILCAVILIAGVKETAFFTIIFMIIEAIGLFIIIWIGLPSFGAVDYLASAAGLKGMIEAGVLIFFGYIGFESIARLAEETKNPEKNIPKAILLSLVITTIIYVLVGVAAVSVVSWSDLASAQAPLAFIAQSVFGDSSFILLTVIALFSTFNTTLAMLLSGSRVTYGTAKDSMLPHVFSKVWKKTRTPHFAILLLVLIALAFLALGDLALIANLTNFTIFLIFILVNAAVIYFRVKQPDTKGFHVPFSIKNIPVLPVFGIGTSLFMIANLSFMVLVLGAAFLGLGVVLYYLFIHFTKEEY